MTHTDAKKSLDEKAQGIRDSVADSFESAADTVRSVADDGVSKINDLAGQASKKLDSTATCVRGWAGPNMLGGLRGRVNRQPIRCLAIAAAVGLVAGVTWRSTR